MVGGTWLPQSPEATHFSSSLSTNTGSGFSFGSVLSPSSSYRFKEHTVPAHGKQREQTASCHRRNYRGVKLRGSAPPKIIRHFSTIFHVPQCFCFTLVTLCSKTDRIFHGLMGKEVSTKEHRRCAKKAPGRDERKLQEFRPYGHYLCH